MEDKQKQYFVNYVKILAKLEENSDGTIENSISAEERELLNQVKKLTSQNADAKKLLDKINSLPPEDRLQEVENYFSNNKGSEEEQEIAKVFGIDVSKIQHRYLENGKELFCFYDSTLGREIILENSKNGKSLVEQLRKIQAENEKYQTANNETNTNAILTDSNNDFDLEIKMLTLEELPKHKEQIQSLSPQDLEKLSYLIDNYESLGIKGIDINNMIYIDKDNEIKELSYNEKGEIVVQSPSSAAYQNENTTKPNSTYSSTEIKNNEIPEKILPDEEEMEAQTTFDSLDKTTQEQTILFYENPELLESIKNQDEKNKWEQYIELYKLKLQKEKEVGNKKVLIKRTDDGYVNNTLIIILGIIILFIISILIYR